MIIIIVCLFFVELAWKLVVAYVTLLVALFNLGIELFKLAWRMCRWGHGQLFGRKPETPMHIDSKPPVGTLESSEVRPLKDDRPINGRISDYYKK